ncbi:hypothetical protein OIN60_16180 [Paenibacillus sp. P96]|uniref:Uncharacterized protein n=1 Tax=Paenibacillus zeirhizosphaerae TaxID=2987519 RepID=A0ABT9FUB8_9BACL|nr:hypothetical protein [Paenibacillus sp. P96]MDP4098295.1 hypothetical protein [Paenibacillus sp. P96]
MCIGICKCSIESRWVTDRLAKQNPKVQAGTTSAALAVRIRATHEEQLQLSRQLGDLVEATRTTPACNPPRSL